jgi:hypothetical protein
MMRYQLIFGGWLCLGGIVFSFIQGPDALICTFFGLFPLIGGLRSWERLKDLERTQAEEPPSPGAE